jgi:hypothetical protein
MTTDPAILEAAARALRKEPILFDYPDECLEIVRVVLAAVAPLIRAQVLEEAALVAEECFSDAPLSIPLVGDQIATAIRALKAPT